MPEQRRRSVVIIGAGPVGCALATLLRRRGTRVDLFERASAAADAGSGRSFNLTLTSRGLDRLPGSVRRRIYLRGTVLVKRVIHHRDGAISTQPYGSASAHHLLSVPRRVLQNILRDQALAAGARIHYDSTCVGVDTARPSAQLRHRDGNSTWVTGDLLIGCDGSGSAVRRLMTGRHPGDISASCTTIAHGHTEISMAYGDADPTGMHLWPRGDHFLQSQPNRDGTFTTSLFKPLAGDPLRPHFAGMTRQEEAEAYCAREFPDVYPRMRQVGEDLTSRPPGRLRIVDCAPHHHGRAVLVGDAAHAVVPFFGQGINCGFEDAGILAGLLDRFGFPACEESGTVVEAVAAEYSRLRVDQCRALADLSMENLQELSSGVDSSEVLARRALERRLQELHPELCPSLYQLVAFSDVPYETTRRRHRESAALLDSLCRGRDLRRDRETVIDEFVGSFGGRWRTGAAN